MAVATWNLAGFVYPLAHGVAVKEWQQVFLNNLSSERQCLGTVILWVLWFNRNRFRHGEMPLPPAQILEFAQAYLLNHFWSSQKIDTSSQQALHIEACKQPPPPMDFLKINFDGAIFKSEGYSGVGVVVRDWNESFILGYSRRFH